MITNSELNITELKDIVVRYRNYLNDKLISYHGKKGNKVIMTLVSFLKRQYFLCNTLPQLLDSYSIDHRNKFSLSLILRTINSDFLTLIYLLTFINNKSETIAFENEIKLLKRDFIKFLEELAKEEDEFLAEIMNEIVDTQKKLEEIRLNNKDFYIRNENGSYKLKTCKELRETTDDRYFPSIEEKNRNSPFVTERMKFDRIKKSGYLKFSDAYINFKYYSQFQHFSDSFEQIMGKNYLLDNRCLLTTIEYLFIGTNYILNYIEDTENAKNIVLKELQNRLLKLKL
jgi:hypothetical protein